MGRQSLESDHNIYTFTAYIIIYFYILDFYITVQLNFQEHVCIIAVIKFFKPHLTFFRCHHTIITPTKTQCRQFLVLTVGKYYQINPDILSSNKRPLKWIWSTFQHLTPRWNKRKACCRVYCCCLATPPPSNTQLRRDNTITFIQAMIVTFVTFDHFTFEKQRTLNMATPS